MLRARLAVGAMEGGGEHQQGQNGGWGRGGADLHCVLVLLILFFLVFFGGTTTLSKVDPEHAAHFHLEQGGRYAQK